MKEQIKELIKYYEDKARDGKLDHNQIFLFVDIKTKLEDIMNGEEQNKKYILLEGLKFKNQFFTTNDIHKSELEKTKLIDGTVAYKILGYAESIKEAQRKLYNFYNY